MLVRNQKSYTILDADDDADKKDGAVSVDDRSFVAAAPESRKVGTHKKRFRKKMGSDDDDDNDDDEEIARLEKERSTKRHTSKNEDDGSESEEERLRDQRERE